MWRLALVVLFLALWPTATFSQAPARGLLPGDRVEIVCAQEPGVCVRRTVTSNGTISLPFLGELIVVTREPEDVAERIASLLHEARPQEDFTVLVRRLSSTLRTILVSGMVERPLELAFAKGMKLQDALSLAKTTDSADLSRITVTAADGRDFTVDLEKGDFELRPGDRVIVPASVGGRGVLVLGGVLRPGPIALQRGMTLAQAVQAAGGVSTHADISKVTVRRGSETIPVDLEREGSFALRLGDVVTIEVVAKRAFVTVTGPVRKQGIVEYKEGMTLIEALRAAGAFEGGRAPRRVILRRITGPGGGARRIELLPILAGKLADPVLFPEDAIEVVSGR